MAELTEALIKQCTGEFDVEVVSRLAIASKNICRIGGLARCCQLVQLDLRDNDISVIEGLESLCNLKHLDLSSNRISDGLAHLQYCTALETLQLEDNRLSSLDELVALEALPQLKSLQLKSLDGSKRNPMCDHPSYNTVIRQKLPQLLSIDGERLQLGGAVQKEMLDKIAPPEQKIELPPPQDWFDGEDLDVGVADVTKTLAKHADVLEKEFRECGDLIAEADAMLAKK